MLFGGGSPVWIHDNQNLQFPGAGFRFPSESLDWLDSGDQITDDAEPLSMFVLWKPATVASNRFALLRGQDGAGGGWNAALGTNFVTGSKGSFSVVVTTPGTAQRDAAGTTTLIANTWYAMGGRFTPGRDISFFLNGRKETETSISDTGLRNSTRGVTLGLAPNGGVASTGVIKLAYVWRRALTDREFLELAIEPFAPIGYPSSIAVSFSTIFVTTQVPIPTEWLGSLKPQGAIPVDWRGITPLSGSMLIPSEWRGQFSPRLKLPLEWGLQNLISRQNVPIDWGPFGILQIQWNDLEKLRSEISFSWNIISTLLFNSMAIQWNDKQPLPKLPIRWTVLPNQIKVIFDSDIQKPYSKITRTT